MEWQRFWEKIRDKGLCLMAALGGGIAREKCISCGKCKRVCPMNVDVTDNSRKRENGKECILCMECVKRCPKGAL